MNRAIRKGYWTKWYSCCSWEESRDQGLFPWEIPMRSSRRFEQESKECEVSVPPGMYTVSLRVSTSSKSIWLLRRGVRVDPASRVDVTFSHEPKRCGTLLACFSPVEKHSLTEVYGLFLWQKGICVLASANREGIVRFGGVPPGMYQCKVMKGPRISSLRKDWTEDRNLGEVRINEGQVTDLGTIQSGD
jgi:hypothetical protein